MVKIAGNVRAWAAIAALVFLAACSAQYRNHGYAPSDEELANIIVGRDTRETVAEQIGTPSASGVLDSSGWYYVESRFRQFAYQAPKEIEREVVAISFDSAGRVANIERFGLEDGRIVTLSRRVTEISADKTPFLRKVFGNLFQGNGLFN